WTQPSEIGGYEIRFRGMDEQGRPIEGKATYRCVEPFFAEAALPAACAADDIVKIPISLINRTTENLVCTVRVRLPANLIANTPPVFSLELPAQRRVVRYLDVLTHQSVGRDSIRIEIESGRYRKILSAPVKLRQQAPRSIALFTGMDLETSATLEGWAPARLRLKAYPTPAAELWDALQGLEQIDEPTVESAAARIGLEYLLLDYLRRHEYVYNPLAATLRERAHVVLERATALLADALNPDGSLDPPARPVSSGALALWALKCLENAGYQTRGIPKAAVVAQRLAQVCVSTPPRSLDVWWMAEAGYRRGLESLWASGERDGAYVMTALALGRRPEAQTALWALMRRQAPDGGIDRSLDQTALFLTALLRFGLEDEHAADCANRAMRYILHRRRADGTFGGPISTLLALIAGCEFERNVQVEKADGILSVRVNGEKVASLQFHTAQYHPVVLEDLQRYVRSNKNTFVVTFEQTPVYIPFVVTAETNPGARFEDERPSGYEATLRAQWSRPTAAAKQSVSALLSFSAPEPALLRVALPAGLVPDEVKFDALVAENQILARKFHHGELWVWTGRKAGELALPLKAVLPGEYGETAVMLSPVYDPGNAVAAVLPPFDVYKP
ncbi:MAG: hypothetical protein RMM53_10300, partial [Bacteroidia bacterium]|nr:hypothetical protein [Bacteroidia bacterium]